MTQKLEKAFGSRRKINNVLNKLILTQSVRSAVLLRQHPPDLAVREGEEVTFQCSMDGGSMASYDMYWYRKGEQGPLTWIYREGDHYGDGFQGRFEGEVKSSENRKLLVPVPIVVPGSDLYLIVSTGYYQRFVPGFGATAAPLHELTKKGSPDPVTWKQESQEAFGTLKAALIKQLILKVPVHKKPFSMAMDASNTGLGAILLQEHEGNQHPVVYLTRKLILWEQNLSSVEKERLAIV
ncbi:hypothetical protein Y1Q_0010585 [Alligator mississippiensis]|uniref:Ig-like domain-containing protein n=1 Tax=Alligator mississippiensis TaxID=8496 RepID=A0A151PGH7_ALLMI|nr:hypothetical protein Y1Q_0010585 [Alligator mississippiensis]